MQTEKVTRKKVSEDKKQKRKDTLKSEKLYKLRKKNPGLAILSFFIVGTGSMALGHVWSGIFQIIFAVIITLFSGGLLIWVMPIVSPLIALSQAKKHNDILRIELDLDE